MLSVRTLENREQNDIRLMGNLGFYIQNNLNLSVSIAAPQGPRRYVKTMRV